MTTSTAQSASSYSIMTPGARPEWRTLGFWKENYEFVLAIVTLLALLSGWIGGEVTGVLPGWAVTIIAVIAFIAGGYSGVIGAWEQARQGRFDIDFLMLAAALGAALINAWVEGALLLFLFTLSGALETYAMGRTRKAIESLGKLRPEIALVRRSDHEEIVPVEQLVIGDVVIVKPGDRLPVDGIVVSGASSIDQSAITGESIPVSKRQHDQVFAGTINGGGALEVEVTKLASESTLSRIINLVAEAQQDATPTQQFIDRFSQPYTYTVIGATLLAILLPVIFMNEPFDITLYRAMTLLVVASPCALVISTPASALSAVAAAARQGVLFKGGAYLELLGKTDILAIDKTGTLTSGKPLVTNVHPLTNHTVEEVMRMAASAETLSEHHIAKAVIEKAESMGLELEKPIDFQAIAGEGILARFDRQDHVETIYIGNDRLFMNQDMNLSPAIRMVGAALQRQGKTVMLVVRRSTVEDTLGADRDWEVMGYIAVADTLRAEAAETVRQLKQNGIKRVIMVTGDNQAAAAYIAAEAGIHEVHADLLPEQKLELVQKLRQSGNVAMVGDGVNDAPALATANVGIAMGAGGTDVALETADVVLMSSNLAMLPFALQLSRRANRIIRQNVIFSMSVIATLVVSTILLPILYDGFLLPLPMGVVGHEGSTLIVVANGLRLLRMRPS
ncbi:MAG: cadmium-translocating P-type ATPase [Caldilineaceae bacterium]|nr:cadmium-translocating P-type ATPase [Caldilineaceae bacterium]